MSIHLSTSSFDINIVCPHHSLQHFVISPTPLPPHFWWSESLSLNPDNNIGMFSSRHLFCYGFNVGCSLQLASVLQRCAHRLYFTFSGYQIFDSLSTFCRDLMTPYTSVQKLATSICASYSPLPNVDTARVKQLYSLK